MLEHRLTSGHGRNFPCAQGPKKNLCTERHATILWLSCCLISWLWYRMIGTIFMRTQNYTELYITFRLSSTDAVLNSTYDINILRMRAIGLWWWYINITITILDIIHRLVFYLKLSSTLQVSPYLTGNTLHLRYEPSNLMLSIGLWRWYINITITILDIIHRPVFYLKLNSTL
jgi:hypothetical protein